MTSSQSNSQVFLNNSSNINFSYELNFIFGRGVADSFTPFANQTIFGTNNTVGGLHVEQALYDAYRGGLSPTDYNSFINNYYLHVLLYPSISQIPASAYDPTSSSCPLSGMYNLFKQALGYQLPGIDLSGLAQSENLPAQFEALITDYAQKFPISSLLTNIALPNLPPPAPQPSKVTIYGQTYTVNLGNNFNNLIGTFAQYLSASAVVNDTAKTNYQSNISSLFVPAQRLNPIPDNVIQSYQDIYEAFNGPLNTPAAQQVFQQRFMEFYNSELQKTATAAQPSGFFDTSQDLADWFNYNKNLYYNPQFVPNSMVKNLHSTIILDQVLLLLINMIGVIQNVAGAQANALNFLSQWQTAYTSKLNQIHTFATGDGSVIGTFNTTNGNSSWDQTAAQAVRNELNNVNQTYISKMQANQQTISDQAKSLQSNVNQSSDAATQQGSVADSILQEMSTILSSIFR